MHTFRFRLDILCASGSSPDPSSTSCALILTGGSSPVLSMVSGAQPGRTEIFDPTPGPCVECSNLANILPYAPARILNGENDPHHSGRATRAQGDGEKGKR